MISRSILSDRVHCEISIEVLLVSELTGCTMSLAKDSNKFSPLGFVVRDDLDKLGVVFCWPSNSSSTFKSLINSSFSISDKNAGNFSLGSKKQALVMRFRIWPV